MARDRDTRRGGPESDGRQEFEAQQGYYGPEQNTQQGYYGPEQNAQQGYYGPEPNVQQGYYGPEQNMQQGYYGPEQNTQQGAYGPEPNAQQRYYGPEQNWQQGAYASGDYYRQASYDAAREEAVKKKKKRKKRKVVLFVLEILLLLLLAAGLYIASQVSRISQIQVSVDKVEESEMVHQIQAQLADEVEEKLKGYWNIALYGVDSRYGQTSGQSDTIMICSINRDTRDVKLVSVYRDSYLDDSEGTYRKATDVYGIYGPSRSMHMLNKNFDLDITNYVTVNMNVLAEVVDSIGGVEIDVKSMDEATWINNYQNETSEITNKTIIPVTGPGLQTLNGLQATSYCRIRAIGNNDYERTERQRKVLMKVLEKFQANPTLLLSVIDDLLQNVETNLTKAQIMDLAMNVTSYHIADTVGFPFEQQPMSIANDIVAPINLAKNVTELHQYLFENETYTPSETVQQISDELAAFTGLY